MKKTVKKVTGKRKVLAKKAVKKVQKLLRHKKIIKNVKKTVKAVATARKTTAREYSHLKLEKKWQGIWHKTGLNKTPEKSDRPKCYILDMFPYPSGEGLHVGHPKGYIATDIYARFKKMKGYNVLHPMGFDSFGLPAENFAIKNKTNPAITVAQNIKRYRQQMEIIGLNYDWSRLIYTSDPSYYHWTQWIFLKLLEKGLAFESYEPINWCPSCQTGLANEDLDGTKCERCGSEVEKKPMRQWVLKITNYADRLLSDLDLLNWPESIKESQRNWIGRSEGSELTFNIANSEEKIKVFTTRPDTLFGVTYVVLAPENPLVDKLKSQIQNWPEIEKYRNVVKAKTEIERLSESREKTGVILAGVEVKHPITKQKVPVFIADYVLNNYGTGAVMAVPAHDTRDLAFAQKYNLPVKEVIIPERIDKRNPPRDGKKKVERRNVHVVVRRPQDGKFLCLQWKKFDWRTFPMGGVEEGESLLEAAEREVREETGYKNLKNGQVLGGQVKAEYFAAHKDVNRVSYTNLVYFDLVDEEREEMSEEEKAEHEVFWIDLSKMTVEYMTHAEMDIWLARLQTKDYSYTGDGYLINSGEFTGLKNTEVMERITNFAGGTRKVTYRLKDWVFSRQRYWGEPIPIIHCEKCGVIPVPENKLPVVLPKVKFYAPTGTGESPLADIKKWVEVKCPKCGGQGKRETNTMPQWAGSSWYYLRYLDPKNKKTLVDPKKEKYWQPVDMYVGGTEHATRHLIYARFWHKFLYDLGVVTTREPFMELKNQGMILGSDNRKMSKRWGNVINPDDVVRDFGADTFRVYEMFMGPFSAEAAWSTDNMVGSRRFLERFWRLTERIEKGKVDERATLEILNRTLKKVTEDIESFSFNTAISALMIAVNELSDKNISQNVFENLLKILSPFAPHLTEELWANLGHKSSIHIAPWPQYDPTYLESQQISIGVQINGKVRASLQIMKGELPSEVEKRALNLPEVLRWLDNRTPKKVIYVENKILSIVI